MYEIFDILLNKFGITAYKFCKDTGVNSSTISTWKKKNSIVRPELATVICEYFGVTHDYLMTGEERSEPKEPVITPKDAKDIAIDLSNIMEKLTSGEAGSANYKGDYITPEAADLFREDLEIALRRLKLINKNKYSPKKYKK